jgi:hypothetical protein
VSPDPTPCSPRWELAHWSPWRGMLYLWTQFLVRRRGPLPPSRLSLGTPSQPAVLGWAGWPQVPTRQRLLDHHSAFAPLLNAFTPQPVRVAPGDCDDTPPDSSRLCLPSVPGGDAPLERGVDVEDRDRPSTPCGVPPLCAAYCGLLCPLPEDPFAGHYGFDPSGPQ